MLLTKGHWWGTCNRYKICATSSCVTLPSKIATAELSTVCGQPNQIRDFWYELLENGIGVRDSSSGTNEAIFRGAFPTFLDIVGPTPKKVVFQCDISADVNKRVLVLGYDANQNWIRTNQGGTILDGEIILLTQSPGTTSVNTFSKVTGIQFLDTMAGQSWLYELNTSTAAKRLIGQYNYWDQLPAFQRYFYPSIGCAGTNSDGTPRMCLVEIVGKTAFVPVVNDNDYLVIGNLPAIEFMAMGNEAARKEMDMTKKQAIITSAYAMAVAELDTELDHYLGSGRRMGFTVSGSSIGQACPIETLL
jgi:hypothetical protein